RLGRHYQGSGQIHGRQRRARDPGKVPRQRIDRGSSSEEAIPDDGWAQVRDRRSGGERPARQDRQARAVCGPHLYQGNRSERLHRRIVKEKLGGSFRVEAKLAVIGGLLILGTLGVLYRVRNFLALPAVKTRVVFR